MNLHVSLYLCQTIFPYLFVVIWFTFSSVTILKNLDMKKLNGELWKL